MMRVPVFTSPRGYRSAWLRGDLIAGLTVWAVLVPEALCLVIGAKLIGDAISALT